MVHNFYSKFLAHSIFFLLFPGSDLIFSYHCVLISWLRQCRFSTSTCSGFYNSFGGKIESQGIQQTEEHTTNSTAETATTTMRKSSKA